MTHDTQAPRELSAIDLARESAEVAGRNTGPTSNEAALTSIAHSLIAIHDLIESVVNKYDGYVWTREVGDNV
jgi:hypothetical protein